MMPPSRIRPTRTTPGPETRAADAIRVLTDTGRLPRPSNRTADPPGHMGAPPTGSVDFAEFVSLALAAAAANVVGIDRLRPGRPGSWQDDVVRTLLTSTLGRDEEHLWVRRAEPLVIGVDVHGLLTDLGITRLYEDSEQTITRMEDAVPVVYDVLDAHGHWTCSDPDAEPMSAPEATRLATWVPPGCRVYREPTPEQAAELGRLAELRERLEAMQEREWAAYGQAFKTAMLAELARAPLPGLPVPIRIHLDATPRTSAEPLLRDTLRGPLARVYQAARQNTPVPGSGIPPRDYPPGSNIEDVERAAGRLPHLRLLDQTTTHITALDGL